MIQRFCSLVPPIPYTFNGHGLTSVNTVLGLFHLSPPGFFQEWRVRILYGIVFFKDVQGVRGEDVSGTLSRIVSLKSPDVIKSVRRSWSCQ